MNELHVVTLRKKCRGKGILETVNLILNEENTVPYIEEKNKGNYVIFYCFKIILELHSKHVTFLNVINF